MKKTDLTKHFSLKEFGLYQNSLQHLKDLAYIIACRLEAARRYINKQCDKDTPIIVTSFGRSPDKNSKTKYARPTSLHMRWIAVDITLRYRDKHLLKEIFAFFSDPANGDYGELFLYELPNGLRDSIHYALPAKDNVRETLIYVKDPNGKLIKKSEYKKG